MLCTCRTWLRKANSVSPAKLSPSDTTRLTSITHLWSRRRHTLGTLNKLTQTTKHMRTHTHTHARNKNTNTNTPCRCKWQSFYHLRKQQDASQNVDVSALPHVGISPEHGDVRFFTSFHDGAAKLHVPNPRASPWNQHESGTYVPWSKLLTWDMNPVGILGKDPSLIPTPRMRAPVQLEIEPFSPKLLGLAT